MEFIAGLILKLSLLGVAIGGVFVGKKYIHLKDDNIAEEVVEQVMEDELGVKIDLTPDSPELGESTSTVKSIASFVENQADRI